MPGTDIPAEARGDFVGRSGGEAQQTFSLANSFRVSSVMDKLALQMQPGLLYDPVKFSQLCFALARGINYAIGNNEVLAIVQHLTITLKQICQRRNNDDVQTAIMVLMLSVKNACLLGWFSDEDNEEFLGLANEIGRSYSNIRDINVSNRNSLPLLSDIMTKFFPLVKLGQILTSVEMKETAFDVLVHDFLIAKNIAQSRERIMLFVAQIDIAHTSACIISPQQVEFFLNGRGVDKRTMITMDSGPQMPTDVTRMLKYGTNLLQAIGQFNGHYLIVIALMSVTSSSDATVLLDHVQPAVSGYDSDLDITVGPSRISLNCPISYTRIKTPVKGQSCKHLRCFDFHNFVDMNSRRPSWRCPHCNQSVCYSDIRIDQNIFKILIEVGDNVSEVIVSAEGSWKAVLQNDDNMNSYKDETSNILEEDVAEPDCSLPKFLDLTDDNYEMDSTPHEDEDKKPSHTSLNIPSVPVSSNFSLDGNGNVSQSVPAEIEDEFRSRILNPHPFTSTSIPAVQAVGHVESNSATHLMPPSTNTLLPALNGSSGNPGYFNYTSASIHSQISSHNNVQIQDSYASILSANEYGSVPPMQIHPSRAPVAVQALPVPLPTTGQQHRSRNYLNSLNVNNSSAPSSITPARDDAVRRNSERLPHLSRHHIYPHQAPNRPTVGAGGMRLPSTVQNQVRDRRPLPSLTPLPSPAIVRSSFPRDRPPLPCPAPAVVQSSLPRSTNRPSPALTHFQNEHLQQALGSTQNIRLPNSSQPQFRQIPAQRATPVARHSVQTPSPPTVPPFQPRFDRSIFRGRAHPVSSTTDSLTLEEPSDQDWRPTGQMRGSLSGRAYSAALDKFIIRPTQHDEPSRPGLAAKNTTSYVDPTRRVRSRID